MLLAQCGQIYDIASNPLPPKHARWQLIFWNKIIFATTEMAINKLRGRLMYYHAEDSQVSRL